MDVSNYSLPVRPPIERMASGDLSVVLAEDINWRDFPALANKFLELVGGRLVSRSDSPVDRLWDITILDHPFWLTYEDFPCRVTLDSKTSGCNVIIEQLFGEPNDS